MKILLYLTFLFAAIIPSVMAWEIRLYDKANYSKRIHYRTGKGNNGCYNLSPSARGKTSSFKWSGGKCEVRLYAGTGCYENKWIGNGGGTWNVPQVSAGNNNKLASYRVYC